MLEPCNRRFAFFQGISENGKSENNVVMMKEQMKKASSAGAELILFPELFLSGYCLPAEQMRSVAEEKDGPSFQELSEAAKQWSIAVLYGYPELDRSSGEDVLYDSAQLIDKDGSSLTNYRKTHLWIDEDGYERVFRAGEALEEVVECCGVKIGILICFDVEFPECVRSLALKGAQLIAVPTGINMVCYPVHSTMVPCRSRENGVYIAYVNSTGRFHGQSVVSDVNGDILVSAGESDHLEVFDINIQQPNIDFLSMRRPEVYCK